MKTLKEMIEEARRRETAAEDFEMKTMKTPPCQRILDEQGYLIIAAKAPAFIGKVWNMVYGGSGYEDIKGPVAVIGESTREEWEKQCIRYAGRIPKSERFEYFYRVTAE